MAYAALTSLSQTLKQIPEPAEQPFASLQEKVSRLLLILEDSSKENSLTNKDLEGQIRDASYEVEYIIESYISTQALSKSKNSCGVMNCFREMTSAFQNMIPATHLCERSVDQNMDMDFRGLQMRINEFDSILETLSGMNSSAPAGSSRIFSGMNFSSPAGSSRIFADSKSTMVGRDEDLMQIKDRLTGYQHRLDVISIVGMGGIGKTTLARNLYNDSLIEHHFHIRAWIVVSQEYDIQSVFKGILDSITPVHYSGRLHQVSIGELGERLYKSLYGRRYLIFMDDIWSTKFWDDVRICFPDNNNGSRIILTTRLLDVAVSSSGHIHQVSFLNADESWQLLRQKALGKEYCLPELEEIGKKIVENCRGLPLAIVVIGGILSKASRTRDGWEYIAENMKSAVTEDHEQLYKILFLSYNSLPDHLKPCFLYMGVFPEDCEIFVCHLVKIWIAEGFIKPRTPKSLEQVAEDYLEELINRNLIMVQKRNHNGGIKSCIIHDLLRDLCANIFRDENFFQAIYSDFHVFRESKSSPLRVSIHSDTLVLPANIYGSSVRSLLYFCRRFSNSQFLSITMSCTLLKVLDALTIRFYEFPIEIVELVHLRYLALFYEGTGIFPASISKLQDLQTLIVYRGDTVTLIGELTTLYLPSTIWEMPQLRHLLLEESILPPKMVGKDSVVLEDLQTLSGIINFKCSREVLEMMPNLKKLGISYLNDADTEWSSYEFSNFVYLHQLETLKCHFIPYSDGALPVNFNFPPNLRKLTLSGCRIPWEKMTIVGSLPNLEVLKLEYHAFEGSVWEPSKDEFINLKFFLIDTSNLKKWRAENTHFPCLQHLCLSRCINLEEIPYEIGYIPTLETLELYECSPSAMASAVAIQEEQQAMGNNSLIVRVHPTSEFSSSL